MEVIIDNIKYETTQLDNGKWTLPKEIKNCLKSRCGALNIDGNRVPSEKPINIHNAPKGTFAGGEPDRGSDTESYREQDGRYPAQTFINSETAQVLDKQSGISKGSNKLYCYSGKEYDNKDTSMFNGDKPQAPSNFNDTGGCSKILHKCDYEKGECDLYFYNPKVSTKPKGTLGVMIQESSITEKKGNGLGRVCSICGTKQLTPCDCTNNEWVLPSNMKNNHPTLKPIKLNKNILALFKTPNEQRIVYPFAGSGSEIIGGIKAGFNNWCGCEISQDYIDIALARIEYWSNFEGCEVPETTEVAEGQIDIWEIL